jgi:hypothetical protein
MPALEERQELLRLAQYCLVQSHCAAVPEAAQELQRIAEEYQRQAAKLVATRGP